MIDSHKLCSTTLAMSLAFAINSAHAQPGRRQAKSSPPSQSAAAEETLNRTQPDEELRKGTALTRQGAFPDAIPHLLTARGHVANEYAASFNLALCYVGTRQFKKALEVLQDLRTHGHANAEVENLVAQSYIGDDQAGPALEALRRAASQTPTTEKVYLFVGDACMDRHNYALGLKVAEIGLKALPDSARLHYQKAVFLSLLDQFDEARQDFDLAQRLGPGSDISYLAAANEKMYAGNPEGAAQAAREAMAKGYDHPILLKILGEALIRLGVRPGELGFTEARTVLEQAAVRDSRDAGTQIALGKLCIMTDQVPEALAHLEKARTLEPDNPAVYAQLAKAYQKAGRIKDSEQALSVLVRLNQAQAEKINASPGERRPGYGKREPHRQTAEAND
jgi:predicted Zn-dependent protease